MRIDQKVGEVVTTVEGHLSRLTYTEKQEYLELLNERIDEITDDVETDIENLDIDDDEDEDFDDDDFDEFDEFDDDDT